MNSRCFVRYHRGDDASRALAFDANTKTRLFKEVAFSPHNARVEMRGRKPLRTLQENGFCLVPFQSSVADQLLRVETEKSYKRDPSGVGKESEASVQIREQYVEEAGEMLKELTGAVFTRYITHSTRYGRGDAKGNAYMASYATFAHCDYAGPNLEKRLGPKAQREYDFAFFNVWQPVANPVQQHPLALLDFQTLDEKEVVDTVLNYQVTDGQAAGTTSKPDIATLCHTSASRHTWYYFPLMEPTEALVFTQYDTRRNHARRCFHTAFTDVSDLVPQHPAERKSIEIRFLCAFEKSGKETSKL